MTSKTFAASLISPVQMATGAPKDWDVVPLPGTPEPTFSAGPPETSDTSVPESVTFVWEADFTPEQDDEWDLIIKKSRRRTEEPDEAALEPHFDTLKAYWNAPNPTAAQTVQAMKSVIFILREMWKE